MEPSESLQGAWRDGTGSLAVQSFLTLMWRHSWKGEGGWIIR